MVSLLLVNGLIGLFRPVAVARAGNENSPHVPTDRECDDIDVAIPNGAHPSPWQVYRDAYCSERFFGKYAPSGVVTIFGSARLNDGEHYERVKEFARKWTESQFNTGARPWPIATGGGGGLMRAGNEGATAAKGPSLGLGTRFGNPDSPEKPNEFTPKGRHFTFFSFSQREAEMVDHARAVIITPGGIGTEWEIMETLSKIQTKKNSPVPVIFLGPAEEWKELVARLGKMIERKTAHAADAKLFIITDSPDEAIKLILNATQK